MTEDEFMVLYQGVTRSFSQRLASPEAIREYVDPEKHQAAYLGPKFKGIAVPDSVVRVPSKREGLRITGIDGVVLHKNPKYVTFITVAKAIP